jgi:dihydroorotase
MYDLVIHNATLVDPAQNLNARRDVAFASGRVAAVADTIAERGTEDIDAAGQYLSPGWVDLHVHVFDGVSHYGVPVDPNCIAKGVTTAVDAGSAGADTFPGFRKYVIEVSATRIFAQLNISSMGMISQELGELNDIRWADIEKALATIEANRDVILGVKVRLERWLACSEASGLKPLHLAREAADAAGLPIMVHAQSAWAESLDDILAVMKERDIVTHCFHGKPICGILDNRGRVRESVLAAAGRGVVFDVGHGRGSFDWRVVERALAQDFHPRTISSDLHRHNVEGPVYDLATTASKFLHLGLPLDEVIARITSVPAGVIRQPDIGTLRPGAWGDATLFAIEDGAFQFRDSRGEARTASRRIAVKRTVRAGQVYRPAAEARA